MINNTLQWTGTAFLLCMYILNSFYPHLHPWNIVAGLGGGVCYFVWTVRVRNMPQLIVNATALVIGAAGVVRAWG